MSWHPMKGYFGTGTLVLSTFDIMAFDHWIIFDKLSLHKVLNAEGLITFPAMLFKSSANEQAHKIFQDKCR